MKKDYLPIGSVVLLKKGTKRVMIYGRRQLNTGNNQEYDYLACLYPEGHINDKFTYVFNHEDIAEVLFRGFSDAEEEALLERMEAF